MTEMTTGEFGGIGVVVTQDKETQTIRVMQVYEDSPADNAGIKEGDIFYKIEGEDITGQDINAVVKKNQRRDWYNCSADYAARG